MAELLNLSGSFKVTGSNSNYIDGQLGLGTSSPGVQLEVIGTVSGSSVSTGSFGRVEGSTLSGDGSAITGVTAEWDGTHTGDGNITGDLTVGGTIYETSAERFKTNIKTVDDQLNNVLKLRGVSFNKHDSPRKEIGLIVEDVNKVYPEFVSADVSSINYGKMITVLVEAIRELNDKVEALTKQ